MKLCSHCRTNPVAGVASDWCKACFALYRRLKRSERLARGHCAECDSGPVPGLRVCERHREATNRRNIEYSRRLKARVYQAYGNKCKCCGESEQCFLTLDHVNNDGANHRRSLGWTYKHGARAVFYKWVIDNQFPAMIQLLCMNCNFGKTRNKGVCPHADQVLRPTFLEAV